MFLRRWHTPPPPHPLFPVVRECTSLLRFIPRKFYPTLTQHPVIILPCLFGRNPADYKIVVGDHNRNTNEGTEETVGAKQIIYHPQYNPSVINNDIALIQLASAVKLSQRVNPICLPSHDSDIPIGSKCYITGDQRDCFDDFNSVVKDNVWKVYELDVCVICPLLLFPIRFSSSCWPW